MDLEHFPGLNKVIITVEVPLTELYVGGFATLRVPKSLAEKFSLGGPALEWAVNRQFDGKRPSIKREQAHPCYSELYYYIVGSFWAAHPAVNTAPPWMGIQRVVYGSNLAEREECNHWHFDLNHDLPGETNSYSKMKNFNRSERENPQRGFVYAVLPAPLDSQKPTVVIPFGGKYSGREIQAPQGCVTYALVRTCWHRADASLGNRILVTVGISPRNILTEEESAYGRI